ncbi:MAG: adenylate kinase [Lachnospiraceae bacterium]|nr:adenylate kinase [Lachnospiraceae bacterium]
MQIGKKILVLGCSGSGKSTLSRKLQEITGLPLVHLDMVFWRPDHTHVSAEEFDEKLAEILQGDGWILDGDYSRTYEVRIRACDTVIFLDYGLEQCMKGLNDRLGKVRTDMAWSDRTLDPELVKYVEQYAANNRPTILALLEKYADKTTFVFKTRAEAAAWLNDLEEESKR